MSAAKATAKATEIEELRKSATGMRWQPAQSTKKSPSSAIRFWGSAGTAAASAAKPAKPTARTTSHLSRARADEADGLVLAPIVIDSRLPTAPTCPETLLKWKHVAGSRARVLAPQELGCWPPLSRS